MTTMPTTRELAAVQQAAKNADDAQKKLELVIRRASRAGASLREIAEVAGMSYESVRRILQR